MDVDKLKLIDAEAIGDLSSYIILTMATSFMLYGFRKRNG
jgi:hypothetical protein